MKVHMRLATKKKVRYVKRKIVATMLSATLLCSVVVQPMFVSATSAEPPVVDGIDEMGEQQPSTVIAKFDSLSEEISSQSIEVNATETLNLPTKIGATLEDDSAIEVDVDWASTPDFDIATEGTYIYQSALAEGSAYAVQDGVVLPTITVMVTPKAVDPITNSPAENPPGEGEEDKKALKVTSFTALDEAVTTQSIELNSDATPMFPNTLNVTLEGESEAKDIDITWATDSTFDVTIEGKYTYTAVLTEGYELGTDVELPVIEVVVEKAAENADGHAPMPTSAGGEPTPVADEPLVVTSNIPVYDESALETNLWKYTTDLGTDNGYTVKVSGSAITSEVARTFSIDINPYNIVDFPFEISKPTTMDPFTVAYDQNGTDKTKVIYTTTSQAAIAGSVDIRLSMAPGHEYTSYYNSSGGVISTVAGAIGYTLLNSTVAPKFGVLVEYNDGSTTNKYEKEHKLDISTTVVDDYSLVGKTEVVDASGTVYNNLDPYRTKDENNGIGGLWLAPNGMVYFKDATGYLTEKSFSLRTSLNTEDHAPIGNFVYQHAVPTDFTLRGYPAGTLENSMTQGEIGYLHDESDFNGGTYYGRTVQDTNTNGGRHWSYYTNLTSDQADIMEGSLIEAAGVTPYLYRTLTMAKTSIYFTQYAYTGEFDIGEISNEGNPEYYTAPGGSSSTIKYDIYTPSGNKSKTYTFDKEIVINIPDYTYVDFMKVYTGSTSEEGEVEIFDHTKKLTFDIRNSTPSEDSDDFDNNVLAEKYIGGTLTIPMPNGFVVTDLKIDHSYSRVLMYDKYEVYQGETKLSEGTLEIGADLEINDISSEATHVVLHIPDEKGFGYGSSSTYSQDVTFIGAFPEDYERKGEQHAVSCDIYLTDSTGMRITGKDDDDLDATWVFKAKGTPTDSIIFELENQNVGVTESNPYKLNNNSVGGMYLYAENPSAPTHSIVYENARVDVISDATSHIELINMVSIFMDPRHVILHEGAEVVMHYTTKENPEEKTKVLLTGTGGYQNNMEVEIAEGETLTSLYFTIDKMEYIGEITASDAETKAYYRWMDFTYGADRLSPEELGLSSTSDPKVYRGELKVQFTADNGKLQIPKDEAYFKYEATEVTHKPLITVTHDIPDQAIVNSKELEYSDDVTDRPDAINIQYNAGFDMHGVLFPKGSAVYLKLNDADFEYIGANTKITQLNVMPNTRATDGTETWLKYDITGLGNTADIEFKLTDFRVKGNRDALVPLFTDGYIDLGPILAASDEDTSFVDFKLGDTSAISFPNLTNASDITFYGDPLNHLDIEFGRLVQIVATNSKDLEDFKISIYGSVFTTVIAYPKVENILGQIPEGENTKATVEYYAHESDDLFVEVTASRLTKYEEYNLTITLPDDDMDLRFDGNVLESLPNDWKGLGATVIYKDTSGNPTTDVSQAKSATITVHDLPQSDILEGDAADVKLASKNLSIPIKASETGVYENGTNGYTSGVTVTFKAIEEDGDSFEPQNPSEVLYKFKWYEMSGMAFAEKDEVDNGFYESVDRYLTKKEFDGATVKLGDNEVQASNITYDEETGKYTILVKPQGAEYVLTFVPENERELTYSTSLPTTGTLDGNNNYSEEGIKFYANILSGLSPVSGSGNLKPEDIDNGMVDIGLVIPKKFTVTFQDTTPDAGTAPKVLTDVTGGSTVDKTEAPSTLPELNDDQVIVGWSDNFTTTSTETDEFWDFETNTVEKDIILYPVIHTTLEGKVTVTFKDSNNSTTIDTYLDRDKNSTIEETEKFTTPEGKVLLGWTTENPPTIDSVRWNFKDDGNTTDDTKLTKNTVLYPVLKNLTYEVEFDANTGTGTMTNQEMEYGIPENLGENKFIKVDHVFMGWSTTVSEDVEYTDKESVINLTDVNGETVTLYAVWEKDVLVDIDKDIAPTTLGDGIPDKYQTTVHHEVTGGTWDSESDDSVSEVVTFVDKSGEPSDDADATATFSQQTSTPDKGFSTGKWTSDEPTGSIVYTKEEITYTYKYIKTYEIQFNANTGTGTMLNQQMEYGVPENLDTNTFTKVDYVFTGWSTTEGGGVEYTDKESVTNLTNEDGGTVTLYAVWKLDESGTTHPYPKPVHKVEFDEDGTLGGTIHETKDNIPDKGTVTLPTDNAPMPDKGEPDKWTTLPNGEGEEWKFDDPDTPEDEGTPVEEDVTLYPYWEHKVEFDKDGESGGDIHETKDDILDKDTVTLPDDNNPMTGKGEPDKWTTEPNGGGQVWEFDDPSTSEKEGTPVEKDVILYPYWEPEVTTPDPTPETGDGGGETTTPPPTTPPTTPPPTTTTQDEPDEEIEEVVDEEVDDTPDDTEEADEPEVEEEEEDVVEESLNIQPPVENKEIEKVTVGGTDLGEEDYSIDESGNLVLSPEFLATLSDGEHKIEIEVDGEKYETVLVMENGIPLSVGEFVGVGGGTRWSLFDLLSTIFVALSALYVAFIKKRKKDDEDEENWDAFDRKYDEIEDDKFAKLRKGKTIALAVEAVMAIILLFITQDFIHMVIFDEYSVAFALSVILAIILVMMANKKPREDDEEMTIAAKIEDYQEEHEEDVKKLRRGKIAAIVVDVLLIAVMFYVTRLGSASLFAIDRFTIIFVLCAILIGTIIPIKNNIDEDEMKNI